MNKDHMPVVHTNCERPYCAICEGGLFICAVCGGAEGSLLPSCPGRQLTFHEDQANYNDYLAKRGAFALHAD